MGRLFLWIGLVFGSLLYSLLAWAELLPEAGPPGTMVTIGGGEFAEFQSPQANRVEFNGIPALIQLWEPDLIMVKVPLHTTNGPVTIFAGQKRLHVGEFTVQQATISRLIPSKAEAGSVLVVEGEHFGNTAGSRDPNTMFGVNQVLVNGIRAQVRKWRQNKIEVVIPANAVSGDVVVRLASSDPLPDGSCCASVDHAVSNTMRLTVIPSITAQPLWGPVGSKVILVGQDFGEKKMDGDEILFNGSLATIAQWSPRTIVVHVPLNATTGPLVLKRGGEERNLGRFDVLQSQVLNVTPRQGPIGTLVTIKGKHFGVFSESGPTAYAFDFDKGQNAVEFAGVPAVVHRWQNDQIDVWVPFSAKSGMIEIKRGGTIPKPDGSCCATRDVVKLRADSFNVVTPTVESYSPAKAGLDEIVTIKGSGFGKFLKIAESTRLALHREAHDWKNYRLGENVSRTEVLVNGVAAQVVSWADHEIKVKVPRRHVFGFGNPEGFELELTTGELMVRRGSWDLLEDGNCCTPKQWISAAAGQFTILKRGLPDQEYFMIPNTRRD